MTNIISRRGTLVLALTLSLATSLSGVAAKNRRTDHLKDWPTIQNPVKRDDAMEQRIAQIISGMTLEQKVGQMTQAEIRSITPEQARQHYIGSILNGGGAWPDMKKYATIADWSALSGQFYKASMSTDMKTQIPIIWGTDAVHGHNNLFGTVLFPHNIGLGAAHDRQLIGKIATRTASTVRATGITWIFAPTLAVVQNPRWGRTYESYSSDPQLVRDYAVEFVNGLQGTEMSSGQFLGDSHALASAKHFIGDGGTFQGKDQGETRASLKDLINVHGAGYYGALEAGVQTVMISYSSWNDVAAGRDSGKMHGNKELISDALKGKMGFDGLVVSDWNAIEQVPGCARAHCPQAINAGIDMIMVPDDWKQFIAETMKDVEAGVIPMSRIDDAVTRILRVKMRSGLFAKSPILPAAKFPSTEANGQDRDLAREAVRKSLVMLKNDDKALPLNRASRILVVGEGADRVERQTGGWSMTWQGTENDAGDFPNATTLLAAIRKTATGTVDYSVDGQNVDVSKYDAVIAVASETPYAEMKGDVVYPASLQHTERYPSDLAALKAVSGKGVPVITVLFSGRPTYVNDLINLSNAFVAAWLPGTEGQGIADGLFLNQQGKYAQDFQGRLPFSWPGSPCPDTRSKSTLFARGYGLTFAKPRKVARLSQAAAPNGCAATKE